MEGDPWVGRLGDDRVLLRRRRRVGGGRIGVDGLELGMVEVDEAGVEACECGRVDGGMEVGSDGMGSWSD